MNNIIFYLEELSNNFNEKLFDTFCDAISDLSTEEYDDLIQNEEVIDLINNQSEQFYNELALKFVEDIDTSIDFYFSFWENIIHILSQAPNKKKYFFEQVKILSINSDAEDFVNGISYLENNEPLKAIHYFSNVESPLIDYFTGLAYLMAENYENSIRKNLNFLNQYNINLKHIDEKLSDFSKYDTVSKVIKWNVYNDLGYAYAQLKEYKKSNEYIEKALSILGYDDFYELDMDSFQIIMHNYYINNKKLNNIKKAKEILEILHQKFPSEKYYKKNIDLDLEVQKIIKRKVPYDINSFIETSQIAKEKNLENLIIDQISYGYKTFDKELEVYEDEDTYGQQLYLPNVGYLDLLLIDKKENTLYVVELKRNASSIKVIEQIDKYINSIKDIYNSFYVKGIIVLYSADEKLKKEIKKRPDIELYTYKLIYNKE